MSQPLIKQDNYWADAWNIIMLRPVYREPLRAPKKKAAPEPAPAAEPLPAEQAPAESVKHEATKTHQTADAVPKVQDATEAVPKSTAEAAEKLPHAPRHQALWKPFLPEAVQEHVKVLRDLTVSTAPGVMVPEFPPPTISVTPLAYDKVLEAYTTAFKNPAISRELSFISSELAKTHFADSATQAFASWMTQVLEVPEVASKLGEAEAEQQDGLLHHFLVDGDRMELAVTLRPELELPFDVYHANLVRQSIEGDVRGRRSSRLGEGNVAPELLGNFLPSPSDFSFENLEDIGFNQVEAVVICSLLTRSSEESIARENKVDTSELASQRESVLPALGVSNASDLYVLVLSRYLETVEQELRDVKAAFANWKAAFMDDDVIAQE